MVFGNKKNKTANSVGKHFKISESEKKAFTTSINKIIGQLEAIKKDINTDNACDETLTQIMAIKGGVSKFGLDLVGNGVFACLNNYTKEELEIVMKNLFKLS